MRYAVAAMCSALGMVMLSGCGAPPPAPGASAPSYSDNHDTAAGGAGLGPDLFKTNGGAFGPDAAGR